MRVQEGFVGKKKKKNAAKAAAARREQTEADVTRAKAKERGKLIKASADSAQKKMREGAGLRLIMPIIIIGVLVTLGFIVTTVPGMLMGGQ